MSTPKPIIKPIENSAEDEVGATLEIDLQGSFERYVRERTSLVEWLKRFSNDERHKTAVHEAFDHYSVFIIFRYMVNH